MIRIKEIILNLNTAIALLSFLLMLFFEVFYILKKTKSNFLIYIILFFVFILNYFKIPTGDNYNYYNNYYLFGKMNLKEFISFLKTRKDYIFYLINYIFYKMNLSVNFWAGFQASLGYLFLLLGIEELRKKNKNISILILLYDPFSVTRVYLAISFFFYGTIMLLKRRKKTIIFLILAVLTHITTLYGVLIVILGTLLDKYMVNFKRYIFFFVLGILILYRKIIIFYMQKLGFAGRYFQGDYVVIRGSILEIIYKIFISYTLIIGIILISIFFYKKYEGNKKGIIVLSGILTTVLIFTVPIVARRLTMILVPMYYMIVLIEKKMSKYLKYLIIILIIIIWGMILLNRMRYAFYTETYPFYFKKIDRKYIEYYLKNDGSLK